MQIRNKERWGSRRVDGRIVLREVCCLGIIVMICSVSGGVEQAPKQAEGNIIKIAGPELVVDDKDVGALYGRALATIEMNIVKAKSGMMEREDIVLNAGADYHRPWTRDASYNTMFAVGMVAPKLARNTLISVLVKDEKYSMRIGGQYWDAIAWVSGAWAYYCYTADREFLEKYAYEAAKNSMRYFEDTEFDPETGLFDGPGWSDGIAGYPPPYADPKGSSFILDSKAKVNGKFIMKALSTNCLYANAYANLAKMAAVRKDDPTSYQKKAQAIRKAINEKLWMENKGYYAYFLDMNGKQDESMEGLGNALAILFDIAPPERVEKILQNVHIEPKGIPCVWPVYPRFGKEYGRHDGTIWPQIQGFWAWACAKSRDTKRFYAEFNNLTNLVRCSEMNFREIYHPVTGEPYGGVQCERMWEATNHQTWAATAYLSMIYHGIFGLRVDLEQIRFEPMLSDDISDIGLKNFKIREMSLDIHMAGQGKTMAEFKLDGLSHVPLIDASLTGRHAIQIRLK